MAVEFDNENNIIRFALPFPPTGNHYVKHTRQGRHYKTQEAKRYEALAFRELLGVAKFSGAVRVEIDVWFPDNRKRDLGNLDKVLLDVLVSNHIIDDDRWQILQEIRWKACGIDRDAPRVEITVFGIE